MMKFRSFYSLAIMLLFAATLSAQTAKLERAQRYMKELNYVGAIELLNQMLSHGDNAGAKIALAECYRKISDSQNAEFLYGQVVRLPEAQPIHFLYYGEMLQRNGKCDLAREWYQKFAEAVPEDVRGQYQTKACDYEGELKTKGEGIYTINRTKFNSNLDDFGAAFYKDGIIFASERDKGAAVKRSHCWTGEPFLDLYFVPIKNCGADVTTGRPEKFTSDVNSKYHDAVVTFTKDQSTIFFTRNNYSKGKTGADDQGIIRLKIYTAKKKGNGFGSEESLPFNSDEYSNAHPAVNTDGTKLYFASDMPGGFGGMDIYVSELENGRWGPPMNLGPGINTEGNELFPFIHASGRLYFASDGHLGLGGIDNFYADARGDGQWSVPENPGAPINSIDDDFGMMLNDEGTCGFFSSDRQGGSGRDDIYSFTKTATPVKIYVYDEDTKEPIADALITSDSCVKKTLKTGKDGKAIVEMKFNTCCDFTAEMAGYDKGTKQGCVKDAATAENIVIEIPLKRDKKYLVEGFVFDQNTGLPLPEAKVTLIGCDSTKANQTFTTDASGKFNFKLDQGCCYKLRGEKDKYFAVNTPDTICTKGLVGSKTYMVNLNLQPTSTTATEPTKGSTPEVVNTNNTDKPVTPSYPTATTTPIDPNIVYLDTDKKLYMKAGKPFTGTDNGTTYKKGKIVGGKTPNSDVATTTKPKDPNAVYFDPEKGLYVKNGVPYTGKHNGETYTNGKPKDSFIPTTTKYEDTDKGIVSYLLHIYYDFDQANLRDESMSELDKLLKLMKDNPSQIVEIASHTDARGSNSYNNRLSQRRAESVVRWLIDKGIERDRLVPRGYGETMTSNNCKNQIKCSEEEHQLNRRTEFRVLGCKDCVDKDKVKLSQPKANPKLDKCHGCPF
jgi:outer membrane protein OmpA-like peptidoglycan-associated protein